MSEKIVQLNEEIIKGQLNELVRGSVEETLNELLEKEAESLTQAARYERSEARQGYRSGHYDRNLTTTSGDVTLHMPRLKGVSFETAIIERYRRRESGVTETTDAYPGDDVVIEVSPPGERRNRDYPGFSRGECQDSDISFIFAISCCELVATECLLK